VVGVLKDLRAIKVQPREVLQVEQVQVDLKVTKVLLQVLLVVKVAGVLKDLKVTKVLHLQD